MPSGGGATDGIDFHLYRALFPRQEARFWGSRSIVDPRITATEVARRVHLSRTAVQARFRSWTESGLLMGYEVWPNPRLFGVELGSVDISVNSTAQVDRLYEDLALVEGVISARDLIDEEGRTVRTYLVDDGRDSLDRRLRLLQRIADLREVPQLHPYWIPEPLTEPTPLEWRILDYYRHYPTASLSVAAADLGISAKTLSARRDRLIDGNAMWWLLNTRSSKFPVCSFIVTVKDPTERSSVKRALESIPSGWVPCADDGFGLPPTSDHRVVYGLSMAHSPSAVDDVSRQIASHPGVASVRWRIPRDFHSYPEWFDRQLQSHLVGGAREYRGSTLVRPDDLKPFALGGWSSPWSPVRTPSLSEPISRPDLDVADRSGEPDRIPPPGSEGRQSRQRTHSPSV